MTAIYELRDPETGKTRYVGKTRQPLGKRLRSHLVEPYGAKSRWIDVLRAKGLCPTIHLLDMVDDADAGVAELLWMRAFMILGADLTNKESDKRFMMRLAGAGR